MGSGKNEPLREYYDLLQDVVNSTPFICGIVLANVLSYIWIDVLGISKCVAPLINLIISIPLNFIINRYWAFKTVPKK